MTVLGSEPSIQPVDVTIETPQGKLLGETAGPDNEIRVFKGIPYALPPVGIRRWQPPEPAPGWSGTRLAKDYSPSAMQPPWPDVFGLPMGPTSEDCLYLNVWTPVEPSAGKKPSAGEQASAEKLPVMVWIHGGARRWGSGEINGVPLARKGVVLVSFNYRVGVFGYFAHPELSAESPHNSSGNYAMLDQIQALKWIQENISAFGGDPDNITLFGNSSGATCIHALAVSPLAKGLFHRVIAQSGSLYFPCRGLSSRLLGAESAEELGLEFAQSAGVNSLAALRDLPAHQLLAVADRADGGNFYMKSGEVIDGWVLPDQPLHICRRGEQNPVSVLAGFTANEGTVVDLLGYASDLPETPDAYEAEIRKRYGDLAEQFLAVYPADNIDDSFYNALRDRAWGWALESWARHTAQIDQPAYLYYFAHIPPEGQMLRPVPGSDRKRPTGAAHGAEVRYVLNDPSNHPMSAQYPPSPSDFTLADIMSDYWVSFAKTGTPDAAGLPAWNPYTESARHYMKFEDASAHPAKDLLPGMWELMEEDINRRLKLPGVGRDYYAVGISSPILPGRSS